MTIKEMLERKALEAELATYWDVSDCRRRARGQRIMARREAGHPTIALIPLYEPVEPRPNLKRLVVMALIFGGLLWLRFGR